MHIHEEYSFIWCEYAYKKWIYQNRIRLQWVFNRTAMCIIHNWIPQWAAWKIILMVNLNARSQFDHVCWKESNVSSPQSTVLSLSAWVFAVTTTNQRNAVENDSCSLHATEYDQISSHCSGRWVQATYTYILVYTWNMKFNFELPRRVWRSCM